MQAQRAFEREQKRLYINSQIAYANSLNEELGRKVGDLARLLTQALQSTPFDLEWLKRSPQVEIADVGIFGISGPRPVLASYLPPDLTVMRRLLPNERTKHDEAVQRGHQQYQSALAAYESAVAQRMWQIEEFQRSVAAGSPRAIVNYFILVLETSEYPDDFPLSANVAYIPDSKTLVVDYDLPSLEVVPAIGSYKYVRARDEITETAAPMTQRKALYTSVIAQVALRTLHELFSADRFGFVGSAIFNGFVQGIDPATGQTHRPCLLSVRTSPEELGRTNLWQVEPVACLRSLQAALSKNPTDAAPVRPLLDTETVNRLSVTGKAINLEQSPNLMDLDPLAFEHLVAKLFASMGLETELTQASHDGGIDCIAYDRRPVLGGEWVIQVKRYRHTVGVSVVRDLFGVVEERRASKGVLVTTSGYGSDSYKFAEGKRIELIDGQALLGLLSEHLGMTARIDIDR